MTQTVPMTRVPVKPRRPMNWNRVGKVYAALVASMAGAALVCWAAMPPAPIAPKRPATGDDFAALKAEVWPTDLPPERAWHDIVLHHSATPSGTLEAIDRYHRDLDFANGVGYHFIINNGRAPGTADGEVRATPRWRGQLAGAHARVARHPEFNADGIGICLIGDFEQDPPTPAQMASLHGLVWLLRKRHAIPLERVLGHSDLKNTRCPGRQFPMEPFLMDQRRADIQERLRAPGVVE